MQNSRHHRETRELGPRGRASGQEENGDEEQPRGGCGGGKASSGNPSPAVQSARSMIIADNNRQIGRGNVIIIGVHPTT